MSKSMNKPKLLHMNGSHTIGICHRWLSKQNQETFFFFAKIYFSNNFEQINSHISTNNTQIIKVVGIVPIFTKHKWMNQSNGNETQGNDNNEHEIRRFWQK